MMGRLSAQEELFYEFRLDEHVPADHLLRRIDAAVDFGFLHAKLATSYSHTGRPSVAVGLCVDAGAPNLHCRHLVSGIS